MFEEFFRGDHGRTCYWAGRITDGTQGPEKTYSAKTDENKFGNIKVLFVYLCKQKNKTL